MSTQKILTIGTPCHEDWEQMTQVEKGRFCDVCVKCVVDLTGKSQGEIKSLYEQHEGNLCGSMPASQYHASKQGIGLPEVPLPAARSLVQRSFSRMQVFAACLVAAFGFFWNSAVKGQKPEQIRGKMAYTPVEGKVQGTVLSGSEPQAKVKVTISKDGQQHTTSTDADGRFAFSGLEPGVWTLRAYDEGFRRAHNQVEIHGRGTKNVTMQMAEIMMLGDVAPYSYIEEAEDSALVAPVEEHMVKGQTVEIEVGEITPIDEPIVCEPRNVEMIAGGLSFVEIKQETARERRLREREERKAVQAEPHYGDEGQTEAEAIQKIDILADGFEVLVSPNPTSGQITVFVKASPSNEAMELLLFSTEGKLVLSSSMGSQTGASTKLNIAHLPAGIYYLKGLQDEYIFQQKVLKL